MRDPNSNEETKHLPSLYPSIHLSFPAIYLPFHFSFIFPSTHLSIHASTICPPIHPSSQPSLICLSVHACPSFHLSFLVFFRPFTHPFPLFPFLHPVLIVKRFDDLPGTIISTRPARPLALGLLGDLEFVPT